MGVVYACAFSFMSKYLYQSCGPKPMTRVDINDNNQSSNNYVMVISKEINGFVEHLGKIFERCRKYGISLNVKKSIFGIDKGNLLGHVVSEEGISVDPKIIHSIKKIPPLTSKKSL
jgi:hypothetical protein